jgi:nucleobase:cation symporter-1, NCS1 family
MSSMDPDAAASSSTSAPAADEARTRAGGRAAGIIELRSIDYVPWSERHGKVWHQGPFWFTSNFVLVALATGFTGPLAGLGLGWTALAVLLGAGIGTFFMAFHANQGPGMGVPQMIQSRAQFGTRGVIVALIPALVVYIGLNVFNIAMATQGLKSAGAGGTSWMWYAGIITAQAIIAIVGYDMLHFVQRWLTYFLIVAYAALTIGAVVVLGGTRVLTMGPFNAVAFFAQFVAVAGLQISFAVYVSDYTRYLPAGTKLGPLVMWTYSGAALSVVWLSILGALFALHLKDGATVASVLTAGNLITSGFGTIVMVLSSIALLTVVSVNTYGATLVSLTAVDGFRPIRLSRTTRVVTTLVVSIATLLLALMVPERYQGVFNDLLTLILYFLVPWSAINLVDYYWVRRGRYSVVEIFSPTSMYGRWGWRGLTAYLLGFVAMVPFFSLPFYTGPGARALASVDISIVFGLVVSGLSYFVLARSLDLKAEEKANRDSLIALEPTFRASAQAADPGTETTSYWSAAGGSLGREYANRS